MSIAATDGTDHQEDPRSEGGQKVLSRLPAQELWHGSAPASVRGSVDPVDEAAWKAWTERLAKRPALDIAKGRSHDALLWGLQPQGESAQRASLIGKLLRRNAAAHELQAHAESWLDSRIEASDPLSAVEDAVESLAWAYGAAASASRLEPEVWWRVVDLLYAFATAALEFSPGEDASADSVAAHQLLAGEMAYVLAALLPELRPLRELEKRSSAALGEGMLAMTDGEGLPPARVLPRLPILLSCWTRRRSLAESAGKRCWDGQAETQYEWLVRQCLRLARPDGVFALSAGPAVETAVWQAALDLGGDDADDAAAHARLRPRPSVTSDEDPPTPSVNSEWSGLAVLASGWKPKSPRITVAYEGRQMQIEIACGGHVLFAGPWPVDLVMEGVAVAQADDWEEGCWFSDEESDYLELSAPLDNGAKLERQIFLAHDTGVAYLSEVLLSRAPGGTAIELNSQIPLAEGIRFEPEGETREGWLSAGSSQLAGVVPLGLPEWRSDPRTGELGADDGRLCLSHTDVGRNACSPLLIDFKPRRFAKQRTWRQLTVGENLARVTPDVAVGYRYQSGKDQWLIYRSLDDPANRTVLGQNYSSEGLIGRFLHDGEVDEYFEIDADDD